MFQVRAPNASQVEKAVTDAGTPSSQVGVGSKAQWQAQTVPLTITQTEHVQDSIAKELGVNVNSINTQFVGPTWGSDTSSRTDRVPRRIAMDLSIAFEWKMVAAFIALLHDILITVGIYVLPGSRLARPPSSACSRSSG